MFMDFSFVIKLESYRLLHSVELRPENEEQLESMVKGMEIDESQLQLSSDDNTSKTVAKNPPRNASCPCGSGKKYKNCCGR
jgi:preprotein translocase subunit SecA